MFGRGPSPMRGHFFFQGALLSLLTPSKPNKQIGRSVMDTGALWDRTGSDTEPPPFPAPTESERKGTKRPLLGEI